MNRQRYFEKNLYLRDCIVHDDNLTAQIVALRSNDLAWQQQTSKSNLPSTEVRTRHQVK